MQVLRSLSELAGNTTPSIVTIGNFDGVHCGHRKVITAVNTRARTLGARSVAVTFDPHPAHVLAAQGAERLKLLTPAAEKLELLAGTGLDLVVLLPFTPELSRWSAEDFAQRVLCRGLNSLEIHEGETFRFGHKAAADIDGLTALGERLGFAVQAYQPLVKRGAPVSSSRIRSLIAQGNVSAARTLLGRPFSVRSTPASGRGYGTLYTVPTINLARYAELLPAHGVYVTTLRVGSGAEARVFRGVTNSGNRPTFGADSFAVETHLLDFEPIALDESTPLELTFLRRIREERRFPSPEALREQIGRDVKSAQRYFTLMDVLSRKPQNWK
jgi:riboflavin kinase / FMN adenylyltransferase